MAAPLPLLRASFIPRVVCPNASQHTFKITNVTFHTSHWPARLSGQASRRHGQDLKIIDFVHSHLQFTSTTFPMRPKMPQLSITAFTKASPSTAGRKRKVAETENYDSDEIEVASSPVRQPLENIAPAQVQNKRTKVLDCVLIKVDKRATSHDSPASFDIPSTRPVSTAAQARPSSTRSRLKRPAAKPACDESSEDELLVATVKSTRRRSATKTAVCEQSDVEAENSLVESDDFFIDGNISSGGSSVVSLNGISDEETAAPKKKSRATTTKANVVSENAQPATGNATKKSKAGTATNMAKLCKRGGLDLNLPPLHNIDDMFRDITQTALGLGLKDVLHHLDGKQLCVATMCSGTESPLLALESSCDALTDLSDVGLEVSHAFSAEIVPFKQAYIERNFSPPLIFKDITELIEAVEDAVPMATTVYGAKVPVPTKIHLLIAGTSCVDFSNLNKHKKTLDDDGESAKTWEAVLAFCKAYKPPIVLIENVKSAPWNRMLDEFREIGYETAGAHVDSKNYYVPQTRQRGYMVCFDKRRLDDAGLQSPGEKWQSLMEKFQRQASSPVSSFLLPSDLLAAKEENVTDDARREVDWVKCAESHVRYRQDERLGNARPFTQWQESGSIVVPENGSASWYHGQVERVFDFLDCSWLRKARKMMMDARFKTRIWDVSQNIYMDEDVGPFGIIPCITPSGQFFASDAGRVLSAEELLKLQAIPLSKISFTTETPRERQDLAGNAMTSTVVGPAMLSALIAGYKLITEFSDSKPRSVLQTTPRAKIAPGPATSVLISSGYETIDVPSLLDIASRAIRRCLCEGDSAITKKELQQCSDCGHVTCIACGGSPQHNYYHDQSLSKGRILPKDAEARIRSNLPLQVQFREPLSGAADLRGKLQGLKYADQYADLVAVAAKEVFCIQTFRRTHCLTITYQSVSGRSHLELVLNNDCAEWQLFAHSPAELPANDSLRATLRHPVAKSRVSQSLFESTWSLRVPPTKPISTTILGHGGEVPSWWPRLGLPEYSRHKQPKSLTVTASNEESDDVVRSFEGTYHLLPRCGTASDSLYKRVDGGDTQQPLFLFQDPTCTGPSDEDCFVFSRTPRRLDYDEVRPTIAAVEASWQPWDDGLAERTVSIALNSKWIDFAGAPVLQPLSTDMDMRKPIDYNSLDAGHNCDQPAELISCDVADAVSSPAVSYEVVSHHDSQFFLQNAWLFESMRRGLHKDTWQTFDLADRDVRCGACAPEKPKIRWKLSDDGDSIEPYEDSSSAAEYERSIKHRPAALVVEARRFVDQQSNASHLRLGANLESMAYRVRARLPDSCGKVNFSWRLNTNSTPSTVSARRQFKLRPITNIDPYCDDLDMSIDLFPKQRRSLAWMKEQESGEGKQFMIEESEEERLTSLGWTLEMRAQTTVNVRGGICADHPGYGKTILSIALDQDQFQGRSRDSMLSQLKRRQHGAVKGLIPSTATLVICPRTLQDQWVEEARNKFGLKLGTDVFTLKTTADLDKKTVAQISQAKLIIVNSAMLATDSYAERLAAFAGVPGPVAAKGRPFEQWLEHATKEVPEHVRILERDGRQALQTHVRKKYLSTINSDDFKATVPSRRLRGKDYMAAQKPKSKPSTTKVAATTSLDTTSVGLPLLEWFYWNRIICDEFHDYDARQLAVIKSQKKDKIWGLSGTPAIGDFYEVAKMAELLGVPLPMGSDSRGVMKQKSIREFRKEMTDFERFDSMCQPLPESMRARLYELHQNFLDSYVTRNVADFQMDFKEYLKPVTLDLDHRAEYTEVSQHLNSIEMRLKKGSKSKTTDREERLYDAIATSETAEEALSKKAAFFKREDTSAVSALTGLGARIGQRYAETIRWNGDIRAAILQAEKHEPIVFEQWRQGRLQLDVLGDMETMKAVLQCCNNSDRTSKQIAATKLEKGTTLDRSKGLTSTANNLVTRLLVSNRSLRFVRNTRLVQESATEGSLIRLCSNVNCQSPAGTEIAVSGFCGHVVCSPCFQNMKDHADTQCPAEGCKATMRDHHLLRKSKMGDLHKPGQSKLGAKIDAAINLLKDIKRRGDQAVLFVQYENQLNEVGQALRESGIAATILTPSSKASAKIEEFKSADTKTTVIVLNASDETATGLNLQNANHVIFLSPLLRDQQYSYDATMAQAIGRVRRHGQKKQIHVYRIVALDTIDVDILEHRERRTSALVEYGAAQIDPPSPSRPGYVIAEPKPERTQLVREDGVYSLRPQSWLVCTGADRDEDELDKVRNHAGSDRIASEQRVKMKGRVLGWEKFDSLIKFSRAYTEDDD